MIRLAYLVACILLIFPFQIGTGGQGVASLGFDFEAETGRTGVIVYMVQVTFIPVINQGHGPVDLSVQTDTHLVIAGCHFTGKQIDCSAHHKSGNQA